MAVDYDSLNNLTTTSVSTDISSGALCGRNAIVDRLDPRPDPQQLSPARSERTASFPVVEPLV